MSVKIIGLDPGLAATGIGIIQGAGKKISEYAFGSIKTASNLTTAVRLEKIYTHLSELFKKEKPDLLIVEDAFSLEKYPKSGITLGKVSGVILLVSQQAGVKAVEIPVREAKQVLTGNGNASKQQLEKAVRQVIECPTPIRPFHASDALGLALIGLFRYSDQRQLYRMNKNSR